MRKALVVLAALAAVALIVCFFVFDEDVFRGGGGGTGAKEAPEPASPSVAAPEKPPEPAREGRARAAEEAPKTLAVAGVVKGVDGASKAGAIVEAFAVPAGEDVPDEQRAGLEMLTKLFGRPAAERLMARGKEIRGSGGSLDSDKMGEVMRESMDLGMDLLNDDGGLERISALTRVMREAELAEDAAWPRVGSATSGDDGAFRIEGLAAGRLELRAKAPGHVRAKVRAAAGDDHVSIIVERGARLAGTVVCEKQPVAGASVIAKGLRVTTAAGGRFEFDAVRVPQETLFVTAEGCVAQGRVVPRTLDGPNEDVEIALDPAGAVTGHVSAVGGGAIAGARVSLGGGGNFFGDMMGMAGNRNRFDVPPPPAVSGADGAFELKGVHLGELKLRVEAEGYLGATVTVSVKRGRPAPCEALLVPESVLLGTVTNEKGEPLAGARVRVEVPARDASSGMLANLMGGTFRSALSDDAGRYAVHGLVEGSRKLKVDAKGYLDIDDSIEIPARGPLTQDFRLREGYRLAGQVNTPDGKPAAGAKVAVTAAGGGSANPMLAMFGGRAPKPVTETGADGKWTATGLQEGPYEVHATADGWLDAAESDVAPGRTDVLLTLVAGATLRGHVLKSADMKPAVGASVQRKPADNAPPRPGRPGRRANPMAAFFGNRGPSVVCDADGNFEMKAVEAGTYDLVATMHGCAESAPARLTCSAGETLDGIEIVLPPGVSVAGRVVERATGAGVPGAVLWVAKSESMFGNFAASDYTGGAPEAPAGTVSAKSDSDGKFVLEGITPGKVTIEVRAADHASLSLTGIAAPSTDLLVTVSAGGTVEGRVTGGPEAAPVADAQVMITRGMMGQGMRQTRTDADGNFRIDRLSPGSWNLMLLDPSNPMMPTMASVLVKDGETTRHDFTKKEGGRQVGGGVLKDGKPLANAPVMLMGGGAGMRMASTDENGRFTFEGLEPGDYTVLVQGSFLGSGAMSRKVTVGSDGKVPDVNLELSSAKIEGDVVDADTGKGVAGAQIMLTAPGGGAGTPEELLGSMRGQALTDDRGHFVVNDVAAGTFTLKASAAGWSAATIEGVASGTRTVRVEVRQGVEFVVTVTGPDDTPIADATVQTVDAAGNASIVFDIGMSSITRSDGKAHLRLAPGRYTLTVTASGLLPGQAEVDTTSGSATVRLDAGATLEVAVTDGTAPVGGAKVTLLDESGAEIGRGMTMDAFIGGGDRTSDSGRWSRTGLKAGKVTVVVTDTAGHEARKDATLELNRTQKVDIVVK